MCVCVLSSPCVHSNNLWYATLFTTLCVCVSSSPCVHSNNLSFATLFATLSVCVSSSPCVHSNNLWFATLFTTLCVSHLVFVLIQTTFGSPPCSPPCVCVLSNSCLHPNNFFAHRQPLLNAQQQEASVNKCKLPLLRSVQSMQRKWR